MNTTPTIVTPNRDLASFNSELKNKGLDLPITQNEVNSFLNQVKEKGFDCKKPNFIHQLIKKCNKKALIILKYLGDLDIYPL